MPEIKTLILTVISDMISDFLYYDRKEDEQLGMEDIQNAVKAGDITIDEMVEKFRERLTEGLPKL